MGVVCRGRRRALAAPAGTPCDSSPERYVASDCLLNPGHIDPVRRALTGRERVAPSFWQGASVRWQFEAIFVVRHGETEWNVKGRRQGQLDSALTQAGKRHAEDVAAVLSPERVDGIFTSPLGRARSTAEVIAAECGGVPVVVPELTEIDHGTFAGLTNAELVARHGEVWEKRRDDKYRWRFPGGESYADADGRAAEALAAIHGHGAVRPVVVSHEMIGRMLMRHLRTLSVEEALRLSLGHGQVTVIGPAVSGD